MKADHLRTKKMLIYGELEKYRILAESLLVGLLVGLVIVMHRLILSNVFSLFKKFYNMGRENFIYIPLIFAVLIFLGYIIGKSVKLDPMITGSGIPQVEGILLRKLKQKWYSVLVLKFVSGLVCLGTGLSLGREGPSVQIGACVGEGFAETTKKMDNEKKYFITCGASAGLAAAFNAPMAGVMFSLEEAHKNFSPIVLLSAISASLAADFASKNFFGLKPSLNFQQLSAMPLKYYWALLILGVVVGISGTIFNKGLLISQILYKKTNLSIEMKCIIPFIITGIVGLTLPSLLGGGHDLIMSLQNLNISTKLLVFYIIIKFIFTFICFGSGAPGGIFFPLLTLGSLVGDLVGIIMVTYFNIPSHYLLNFIVIAMAGHFAAIVKSPITAIILISEMTGSLNHLLSLAVVSLVALLVSDLLNTKPIYEALLDRILQSNHLSLEGSYNKKTLVEVSVELGSVMDNNYIKDIAWPEGCLVVSILRGEKEIIPCGSTLLLAGDLVTVMTNEKTAPNVLDDISKKASCY